MDENQALGAFAVISNATRLRIVRLLVVAGADGRSAGAIGHALGCLPPSRLSFHLSQLEQAGIVVSRREGRSSLYGVIFPALSDLVAYFMHDCREGIALCAINHTDQPFSDQKVYPAFLRAQREYAGRKASKRCRRR